MERKLARGMAARLFASRSEELVTGLAALWQEIPAGTPVPDLRLGDARALAVETSSVDVILTSPPYAGTYDYHDHHALRLQFLGLDSRRFVDLEIGARRAFADVGRGLAAWQRDLGRTLEEMRRVVRVGGKILLLMGDSLAGKGRAARAVLADELIDRLAPGAGLIPVARASQARPMLGAAERSAFAAREKREHLIQLEVR
jgi:hypothetical protein